MLKGIRKKEELLVPLLQVLSDFLAIVGSFVCAYFIRFHSPLTGPFPVTKGFPGFSVYLISSLVTAVIWMFIMKSFRLYGPRRNNGFIDECHAVVRSVTLGMLIVLAAAFFYRGFSYSRLVFVLIWMVSILFLCMSRGILLLYEKTGHRRGRGVLKAAVVGSSLWGEEIIENISRHPGLGLKISGYFGDNARLAGKCQKLGSLEDMADAAKSRRVDILFLAPEEHENSALIPLIMQCIGLNIELYLIPSLLGLITSRMRVEDLEGIPVIKIKDIPIRGWNLVFKRGFDLLVSSVGLLILAPLFAVIALAVKTGSKGPVFFRQERLGLDGHTFGLVKFRTMIPEAEKNTGPVWTVEDDPRVTRAGRFLRRWSLDELPQLINVFRGEMSLVGPRPERPHFVEQFKDKIPVYLERHRVKCGMTGWAQVNGFRGNVSIEERTKYDIFYVENWSVAFDIKIILLTAWAVITGKNSY